MGSSTIYFILNNFNFFTFFSFTLINDYPLKFSGASVFHHM